ncbi:MAG TPA: restriction endonuclease subunit S [Petrimonas sp.]|nr:restriction endonuclease subunit S [Petrimonas sp.]
MPNGWVWGRLSEIVVITGGGTPSMNNPDFWNGNIPWVTPKDMSSNQINGSEMKITQLGLDNSSAKLIDDGSILIVGRSGILRRRLPVAINLIPCSVNQDMKVLTPIFKIMNRFLQMMLYGLEQNILRNYVKFGMTVHSLRYDEFSLMPIPIPPLAEQHRIVNKIDQLIQFCEEIETTIKQNQNYAQELLQVALKEALTPVK